MGEELFIKTLPCIFGSHNSQEIDVLQKHNHKIFSVRERGENYEREQQALSHKPIGNGAFNSFYHSNFDSLIN